MNNLPPGVTEKMINDQAGGDYSDWFQNNESKLLEEFFGEKVFKGCDCDFLFDKKNKALLDQVIECAMNEKEISGWFADWMEGRYESENEPPDEGDV